MTNKIDETPKALRHYLSMLRDVDLEMIDGTIASAREGGVHPDRVDKALRARADCVDLFNAARGMETGSAEFQRAMDAGQRLFDIAENLNDLLVLREPTKHGRTIQQVRSENGKRTAALTKQRADEIREPVNARYRVLIAEKRSDDRTAKARTMKQLFREFRHVSESTVRRALSIPEKCKKS